MALAGEPVADVVGVTETGVADGVAVAAADPAAAPVIATHAPAHAGEEDATIVPARQPVPGATAWTGKRLPAQHCWNDAVHGDAATPDAASDARSATAAAVSVHSRPVAAQTGVSDGVGGAVCVAEGVGERDGTAPWYHVMLVPLYSVTWWLMTVTFATTRGDRGRSSKCIAV